MRIKPRTGVPAAGLGRRHPSVSGSVGSMEARKLKATDVGRTSVRPDRLNVARTLVRADGLKPVPHLSIIVVTWNSERWIGRCLRALPAACEGLEYEVLVYDNASHDSTLRLVGDEN